MMMMIVSSKEFQIPDSKAKSQVQRLTLNASTRLLKILNASGQPSNHFFTRLRSVNNSHLAYLNRWQIPLLPFSVKRLSPSKSPSLSNYAAVPHLLILISHTAMNYSRTSRLSPQLKYLNYSSQCQINRHNSTTSQLHRWHSSHLFWKSPAY